MPPGQAQSRRIVESTRYPSYSLFLRTCQNGLSVIYPFKTADFEDPYGWKYKPGYPPSYAGFGRMRSLLAVHDALKLKPGRVLEVASGEGGLAASLAANGCQVVANDLLEEKTARALSEYHSGRQVKFISGNLFDLSPEQLGTFDLVIACEVFEHVAHPDQFLSHLKGFLSPGGRILLTTPNGSHFRNRLPTFLQIKNFDELETRQFKPDADGHLFLFTPEELCDLAASTGLRVERVHLWGTPMLSGHSGFRFLSGRHMTWGAYGAELLAQRVPTMLRSRISAAMTVILSDVKQNESTEGD